MIIHADTLLLTENIFHTIIHYDIQIKTSFFSSNLHIIHICIVNK